MVACLMCCTLSLSQYALATQNTPAYYFPHYTKYAETKLQDCCGPFKASLKRISSVNSGCLQPASSTLDSPLNHATSHSNTFVEGTVERSVGSLLCDIPSGHPGCFYCICVAISNSDSPESSRWFSVTTAQVKSSPLR